MPRRLSCRGCAPPWATPICTGRFGSEEVFPEDGFGWSVDPLRWQEVCRREPGKDLGQGRPQATDVLDVDHEILVVRPVAPAGAVPLEPEQAVGAAHHPGAAVRNHRSSWSTVSRTGGLVDCRG